MELGEVLLRWKRDAFRRGYQTIEQVQHLLFHLLCRGMTAKSAQEFVCGCSLYWRLFYASFPLKLFQIIRRRHYDKQDKLLKTVELSNEQNHNMTDELLNNGPALSPQPAEKEMEKVKKPTNKQRSWECEER